MISLGLLKNAHLLCCAANRTAHCLEMKTNRTVANMSFKINNRYKKKQEIARPLIKRYLASRKGLIKLGVLRTGRSLQGDYAEWLAAEMLNLDLAKNTVEKGFDAIDKDGSGRTYQIKSRIVKSLSQNTSFDFVSIDSPFDYLICIFFSSTLELLDFACVPYEVVRQLGNQNEKRFSFRWNKRTASDPRIKKINLK